MAKSINKDQAKQKIEALLAEYDQLKADARSSQEERKKEIKENLKELEMAERDLQEKYDRINNFGDTTMEEFSKEFFTSAEAFSNSLKSTKNKM